MVKDDMDKRKEQILRVIIKEHIKTGLPVGSGVLAGKYRLGVSSATVRNEMADLEEEGYIRQPHTSAGRVPTEKAYDLFLKEIKPRILGSRESAEIGEILKKTEEEQLREAAKVLARVSEGAIFWAFHKNNLYYTGISNLLQQPEFVQNNLIYDISLIIDRMDEVVGQIFDRLEYGPQILIGAKNPFSPHCSSVLAKYRAGERIGLLGILGPMRMDYEKNLSLVDFVINKLKAK